MLNNTIYKLKNEKKLTLGFFGGSDTDGTGASDMEKTSYRALVTKWFKDTYSDAEITSINASIGGTGTGYASFRCESDLIAFSPDLVFVEYCGNDWGDSYENVLPQAETVLRKIRKRLPTADIVTVISMYTDIAEELELGLEHEARTAMAVAAHRYGASYADAGTTLLFRLLKDGADYDKYFADGLHPSALGHSIMAESITSLMKGWLSDPDGTVTKLVPWDLPEPLCPNVYDDARMVFANELDLQGAKIVEGENGRRGYFEALAGESFSFSFTGDVLGFIWDDSCGSSDVDVSVDGGEPVRVRSWDYAVRSFDRFRAALFMKGLDKEKKHTASVKVCGDPEYGGKVRIMAVLMD